MLLQLSQISLLCLPPSCLLPASIVNPHTIVLVHVSFIYVLGLISSPSISQSSATPQLLPLLLTAVSLFHDSMPLKNPSSKEMLNYTEKICGQLKLIKKTKLIFGIENLYCFTTNYLLQFYPKLT